MHMYMYMYITYLVFTSAHIKELPSWIPPIKQDTLVIVVR